MKRKYWTDEEKKTLVELYPNTLGEDLARLFQCSIRSVYNQASLLGLKKDAEFIARIARERTLDPNHKGRKYQFKKGHKPKNKGKRQIEFMSQEAINRTKATRFQKGSTPHNHRPVGGERLDKDGYVMIKVAEPRKWKLKHRVIWEESNGPILKGANIQFKDGNRQNIHLDNLYLITRDNQINQNTIHRYPQEVKTAIRRINKLEKLIRDEK